jgi:hypothetical protein
MERWIRNGIAEVSEGQFACPTFAVPKVGRPSEPRWVHDLRQRNNITYRDYTAIPDQRRMLDAAANARYLSVLDLTDAYHQIRIDPMHEQYNVINTPTGTYKVRVMLQGDANAPATMMRNMTAIFGDIIGEIVWVYLDDVIVFSQTRKEHIEHLREIFRRLQKNSFYLKLEKCQFMSKRVKLLGHYIENGEIKPDAEQINKIKDWKTPTNQKQLQSFIGLVNYIAPHLPHAATTQARLTELTGAGAAWRWNQMHQDAFNELKRLCDEAVPLKPLKYRDIKKGKTNVFLVTDASKIGVGAFICHGNVYEDARNNIAALHSRKFTSAQEHYMTTEQECLAMVDALKAFETRLLGIPFTIITDHQALQFILNSEIKTSRQIRWLEYMQRFNFTIKYAPGSTNILADALSRIYEREKELTGKKLEKVVNMDVKDLEEREYGTMKSIKASGNPEEELQNDSSNEDNYLPTDLKDFRNSSAFTSYGSMAPRRPTCDAGLHWKFCQLKDAGCPFHGTTGIFVSDSRWVDQISYNRRIKEWDEQHGSAGAASSSTVNPSNTTVVRGGLSEVSKRARRRRRQLERGDAEPPSESLREIEDKGKYTDLDEDGYPRKLRIRWKSINEPGGEDSAVAGPSSGNTNLQIATSHVITRSKARKITSQKDTGGGSWIEVQNPKPTRSTQREVANLEEMAAEMEAKTADDAETEIEDEVMAEIRPKEWPKKWPKARTRAKPWKRR